MTFIAQNELSAIIKLKQEALIQNKEMDLLEFLKNKFNINLTHMKNERDQYRQQANHAAENNSNISKAITACVQQVQESYNSRMMHENSYIDEQITQHQKCISNLLCRNQHVELNSNNKSILVFLKLNVLSQNITNCTNKVINVVKLLFKQLCNKICVGINLISEKSVNFSHYITAKLNSKNLHSQQHLR